MKTCEHFKECANDRHTKEEQSELCYKCGKLATQTETSRPQKPTTEDRSLILLRATYDILKKCDEGGYVKNVMTTTAIWDDAECDGYCLMAEIKDELCLDT